MKPEPLPLGLDDPAPVRQAIQSDPDEALRSEALGLRFEAQVARHDQARAFVCRREDVAKQLGAELGGRDVAQLIEHQEIEPGPQHRGHLVQHVLDAHRQPRDQQTSGRPELGALSGRPFVGFRLCIRLLLETNKPWFDPDVLLILSCS